MANSGGKETRSTFTDTTSDGTPVSLAELYPGDEEDLREKLAEYDAKIKALQLQVSCTYNVSAIGVQLHSYR